LLAEDRTRTREELLQATERELAKIQAATVREKRPLRGKDKIALRVGRNIGRYKMQKHFVLDLKQAFVGCEIVRRWRRWHGGQFPRLTAAAAM
jgi:hypothetical protein